MKDQHTKISGYRDLSQQEIDLMNEAKALEAQCLGLYRRIGIRLGDQSLDPSDHVRLHASQAMRWHKIARTDIETGFMALIRAIAQPLPKE